VAPFHDSASVTVVPAESTYEPTAMHARAALHDTPDNVTPVPPGGSGTGCAAHEVPSHACASAAQ